MGEDDGVKSMGKIDPFLKRFQELFNEKQEKKCQPSTENLNSKKSYRFGKIFFEETGVETNFMLCAGDAGECPPEEVFQKFTSAFGMKYPKMLFKGLGANGDWERGFATYEQARNWETE